MSKESLQSETNSMTAIFGYRALGTINSSTINGVSTIAASGTKNFWDQKSKITDKTIVGIGSITKQFTAATLLTLWDKELTDKKTVKKQEKEWFPNGIDTPLSHYMPALEEKFPECKEMFAILKADKEYDKVTLRDLLQHTHGLGGRNEDKAANLLGKTGERPITLSEMINATEKDISKHRHGLLTYSNFGFDCAAMAIEAVADDTYRKGISFDETVKELVLLPNNLPHTYTQSDHQALYKNPSLDIARGYALDIRDGKSTPELKEEMDWNTKANTRAAGGFKSTVGDLTQWAALYMGATMFTNEEVKKAVTDRTRSANFPNAKMTYHLAIIETQKKGEKFLGHPGCDVVFLSDLLYNPDTRAVQVSLTVAETLTPYICNQIFSKGYPQDQFLLDSFKKEFFAIAEKQGSPDVRSPEAQAIMLQVMTDNPKQAAAVEKYCQLYHRIETYPPKELAEQRESIIQKEVNKITTVDMPKELQNIKATMSAFTKALPSEDSATKDPTKETFVDRTKTSTPNGGMTMK